MATAPKYELGTDGRRYYETNEVAKIVRIVLAREYPKTKFYVRLQRYAGGSSIRAYFDGAGKGAPKRDEVQRLIGDYVNHDFDGMTDSTVRLDHWMMPDYSATIAHRGAFTFNKAINKKKPHKDAVRVLFGASFVFAEDYLPYKVTGRIG
jgi:hypothetical protein